MEVDRPPEGELRRRFEEYFPRLWRELGACARPGSVAMKAWLDRQQALSIEDCIIW